MNLARYWVISSLIDTLIYITLIEKSHSVERFVTKKRFFFFCCKNNFFFVTKISFFAAKKKLDFLLQKRIFFYKIDSSMNVLSTFTFFFHQNRLS